VLEFRCYLPEFHRCNYVRFSRPYRYDRCRSSLYILAETIFHLYIVLYPRFVVGILTVLFTVSNIQVFRVSAAVSDCRSLLESPRYTSCEFAIVDCRWFAVGMLMVYVVVSEISVLPVIWLPSWISGTHRRPTISEVPLLERLTQKTPWQPFEL